MLNLQKQKLLLNIATINIVSVFCFWFCFFGVPSGQCDSRRYCRQSSFFFRAFSLSHSKLRAFPCLISTFQATFQIVFADCFRVATGFVFWVCGHGGVFIMWRCLQ